MERKSLFVPVLVIIILSSTGAILYQQNEISRLRQQNRELQASNSQRDKELSDLRVSSQDEIASLRNQYDLLNSRYEALRLSRQEAGLSNASIYFDKSIYYPDPTVFWNSDVSAPIEVTVVDGTVDLNSVTVRISSSVDSRDITLTKTSLGVFKETVFASGLRLGESVSDTARFSVRYGDIIVAQYYDARRSVSISTAAFFEFPIYVMYWEKAPTGFTPAKLVDSDGVLLNEYGSPTGIQYNPAMICGYAIDNYDMYLATGNQTFRETFFAQVNWLVKNAEPKGTFSVWEYRFDWPWKCYNATNPWPSALAQGGGLGVLTRAYVLTGNTTYLEIAETAMRSFEVEMSSGGVRYTDSDGVWYEEIADVGARSGKVLNGFLYALFGLYEYYFETQNTEAYGLFLEGTRTLESNLYRYDTGSWSYYDLLNYSTASTSYHKTHIDQLRTLYKLTGSEIFLTYSDKFQSYMH